MKVYCLKSTHGTNKKLVKVFAILALTVFTNTAFAEIIQTKIFYNNDWVIVEQDQAVFYRVCNWDTEKNYYDGKFSDYLVNGTKIQEGQYQDMQKNGEFVFYHETGNERLKAQFTNNLPVGTWQWNYPDGSKHFSLLFKGDDFQVLEMYNNRGERISDKDFKFKYEFKNDDINDNLKIEGAIKNGKKEGKWKVSGKGNSLGYDIYKNGEHIKTVFDEGISSRAGEKIVNYTLFIPYSVYGTDEIRLSKHVLDDTYPFLSSYSKWEELKIAFGLIGDSVLTTIDQKPRYWGGLRGLNKRLASTIRISPDSQMNCKNWGYVYYEILIDKNGNIESTKITKSPDERLSKNVLDALRFVEKCRPAIHNGQAIKSKFTSRIKLQNKFNFSGL